MQQRTAPSRAPSFPSPRRGGIEGGVVSRRSPATSRRPALSSVLSPSKGLSKGQFRKMLAAGFETAALFQICGKQFNSASPSLAGKGPGVRSPGVQGAESPRLVLRFS